MVSQLLERLATLQINDTGSVLHGNYPSTRYHKVLPLRRAEDNVYFVAWINQVLMQYLGELRDEEEFLANKIIEKGEQAISAYRNRYGDISYNFYRPHAWFPNGIFLSRFGVFQPTDDSDDTSIAFRGKRHTKEEAEGIKEIYRHHSNGKRGRWIRRLPKNYRKREVYNTWIGSEQLFIDIDIVVLSNILIFNARYDLGIEQEDEASLQFIRDTVANGEFLEKSWSLAAWYPFASVILYSIADMIAIGYYDGMETTKAQVLEKLNTLPLQSNQSTERLLFDAALMKLGAEARFDDAIADVDIFLEEGSKFSFGVIPLLNPFDGLVAQRLSSYRLFRMFYDCEAQRLVILWENLMLRKKRKKSRIS